MLARVGERDATLLGRAPLGLSTPSGDPGWEIAFAIWFVICTAASRAVTSPLTRSWRTLAAGVQTAPISGMLGIGCPLFDEAITTWVTGFDLTIFAFESATVAGTRPDALYSGSGRLMLR